MGGDEASDEHPSGVFAQFAADLNAAFEGAIQTARRLGREEGRLALIGWLRARLQPPGGPLRAEDGAWSLELADALDELLLVAELETSYCFRSSRGGVLLDADLSRDRAEDLKTLRWPELWERLTPSERLAVRAVVERERPPLPTPS